MSQYKPHHSAPERNFDHLYDPLYAASCTRDVWRNNARSLAISAQIQIYPVFETMFTDLPYRPRNYFIPLRNPLPFVNARDSKSTEMRTGTEVTGIDRAKFFNAPLSNKKTVNLHLDLKPKSDCGCLPPRPGPIDWTKPPFKTVAMQTDYREQSAQTKAWMPNAVIGPNEIDTPEIVYVAELLKDDTEGTIPGIYEAELVARARKRREWEQSLPKIASQEEWDRRRLVLAAFEWEEWVGREKKIEYCQKLRLGIVEKMMKDRALKKRRNSAACVALKSSQIEKKKEHQLEQLRTKYRRRIKRCEMEHKNINKKYLPTNVIDEHIDPASDLYAPQSRFGVHPKHRHFMAHKTNYQARLDGLHDSKKPFNCKPFLEKRMDLSLPRPPVKEVERNLYNDKSLRELYESLLALRSMKGGPRKTPQCMRIIPPSFSAMLTNSSDSQVSSMQEEMENQKIINLQRIIRGRAVQNQIFAGRNNCRELIAEFRTTHQLPEIQEINAQHNMPNQLTEDRKFAHFQQMQLVSILSNDAQILDLADQAKGTTMSFALDLLEKELIRLQDQKKAHALCMLAEHERYSREAYEAAHRMRGDNRRRLHDEVSRNVQLSKHNSIATYLEDVLVECLDKMAEKEAREKIRDVVRQIDLEAENPTPQAVVTGILNRFILPDVFRRIARDNYLADVHQSIFGPDGVIPDQLAVEKQLQLNRFLESAVSPRQMEIEEEEPLNQDVQSTITSIGSDVDPAHYEALRSVERAIVRAVDRSEVFGENQAHGILDNIISMAIPPGGRDTPHSQRMELQVASITCDLKVTMWDYAEAGDQAKLNEIVERLEPVATEEPIVSVSEPITLEEPQSVVEQDDKTSQVDTNGDNQPAVPENVKESNDTEVVYEQEDQIETEVRNEVDTNETENPNEPDIPSEIEIANVHEVTKDTATDE